MKLGSNIAEWLNIRPHEVRALTLSFWGAFLVLAFMTLARSLRDAVYLATFDVRTLPYIMAAVVVLSLPTVALFSRLMGRHRPLDVLRVTALIEMAGLLLIWPLAAEASPAVIVLFYLWTALGTLLLTSGFWIVTAEQFEIRGAKRLFGLIGAGGTAGAMVMGFSLTWITEQVALSLLVPLLVLLLLVFVVLETLLPGQAKRADRQPPDPSAERASSAGRSATDAPRDLDSTRDRVRLIWNSPHLRTIAAIVLIATMASTLVDYQFKDYATAHLAAQEAGNVGRGLTRFFGTFYAITGGLAMLVQLVGAARIMAVAGVGGGLAILPATLLMGSLGLLFLPTLWLAALVRGADNVLRKSVHRPFLEYLYVPLPAPLRRKTKTFIDSVVDSVAEGVGALAIFLLVTLAGLPARALAIPVVLAALFFIHRSRQMGREYFDTIVDRLRSAEADAWDREGDRAGNRRLLSASFTRLDLGTLHANIDLPALASGAHARRDAVPAVGTASSDRSEATTEPDAPPADLLTRLRSPDERDVRAALEELAAQRRPTFEQIEALVRLLARDRLYEQVVATLAGCGDEVLKPLTAILADPQADFVIRRRVPNVLAATGGPAADDALIDALAADRFEVRYRAAVALRKRRLRGLPTSRRDWRQHVWRAIAAEVQRDRPVWELQKILDQPAASEDDLVTRRVGVRGELSLEHTFRMLSLVLDPEPVRAAFQGILLQDEGLRDFALEYLEQVLPDPIRKRLWVFIGDVSDRQRTRALRPLDRVVSDLMTTRATLFAGEEERDALKRMLKDRS